MYNPKMDAYCESIDHAFLDYMTHKCNSSELCKRLAHGLNGISEAEKLQNHSIRNCSFEVILIDGKNDFCGIKVYPDCDGHIDVLCRLSDNISIVQFCERWLLTIDKYIVEIDINCFNKQKFNFTNKELTAMMIHEMAHIAYNSTLPEMIYNSYKIHKEELKYGKYSTVKNAIQTFYTIPALLACSYHVMRTGIDGRKEEYIADKLLGIESYRPYLYSAIDKIIRAYGTSIYINKGQYQKVVDNLIAQNNLNISELSTRRRIIRDDLLYQSANTHSKTIRKAYIDIIKQLGIAFVDRYTNAIIATESLMADIDSGKIELNGILNKIKYIDTGSAFVSVLENAFNPANECCLQCKCTPKMPTNYDIEMVSANIDKIHSNIDKLSTLDELYNLLEKITVYTNYAQTNNLYDASKYKIEKISKTILDLINNVKSKEVTVTKLSEYLEYPDDYSKKN